MSLPYAARRDRLAAALPTIATDTGPPDAVLITDPVNVRYLSGFTGSNGALLVAADTAVLATDGRYSVQAGAEAPDVDLMITRALTTELAKRSRDGGAPRLGFEDAHLTVAAHRRLAEAQPDVTLVPAGLVVEALRQSKDEAEIDLLREACAIGDRALADLLPTIRPGRTERELARALDQLMLDHGADERGFSTIVAGGPHSAIPHHQPTDRPVEVGDLLKLDFGARYRGYHADMTRTLMVGAEPAAWQRELHDLVAAAQRAGWEALAVGAEARAVDAASRSVIEAAGHGPDFPHGLGHGVGLMIHEDPFLGLAATGTLDDRTVVTVEPGVYLPGRGGVRIEDTLVVRADQSPELLTQTTKDLLVCA